METDSRQFGLFIDGLRLERNITREDLCDGIISLSQYKRYIRGDASIPNNKLVQIADKLKFSVSDIHIMYTRRADKQLGKINEIYNKIKNQEFEIAYKLSNEMKDEVIVSEYNQLFFDYCMVNIQHNLNMVSDVHVLEIYSKMINFPYCKDSESFNWIEFNILMRIVKISAQMGNYEPSEILYGLLTSRKSQLNFSTHEKGLPNIYFTLSQILGAQEKYDQVIEITNLGIEFCLKKQITTGLVQLYFVNAFALSDLDRHDEAIDSAKKAFMLLYIEDEPSKFNAFKKTFEDKFEMKLEEIIDF